MSTGSNSLIIGTSKAEKLPTSELNAGTIQYEPFYNFAFNLGMSPYGPVYNKQIIKRVTEMPKSDKKKVFLLCVDPWAFSNSKKFPNDSTKFYETETEINFIADSKLSPIHYFLKYYRQSYINLFLPQNDAPVVESRPDSSFIDKHMSSKIAAYRKHNFENSAFSQLRYSYFEKLIVELKNHGEVYLVRLPVSRQMIELEKEYMQDFGYKIQSTANKNNIGFIDFYPEAVNYLCPDGNHLYWEDAASVSKKISQFIQLTKK
jgi:hypothetical protein